MESIYLILIVILFVLAISDLVVGVSNDAVNFLNSAVGAKAGNFRLIMVIAALGVLVGATFSSGMMEVARKGIFHPQYFYFSEIIIIFLAVMITDVILLDLFNTFGMPTSTTVSIVFELLGAAVAVSIIKVLNDPNALELSQYINSAKALAIISGILLSVVVAFTVGAIIQYFSRLIFSFDYEKRIKYYGSIWGGLAIAAITYFMLIKGAKGAAFMSDDVKDYIKHNSVAIIGISFVAWTIILQIVTWITRFDILKFIVLVGTFALAMAFAGNDLVNFIGVPLAGYESYKSFIANPGADPNLFLMTDLVGQVKTPTYFLLIAGLIMVITLWTSRKAKSVIKTSVDLGRQEEGEERFGSTLLARTIVRNSNALNNAVKSVLPESFIKYIDKQFDHKPFVEKQKKLGSKAPAFDMIRASVTLVVASILIAFATSLKLPLSTTYVTFMVAMGTSLSDKAWGRESAVYRITGVISVIGGWFFTAFSAFVISFVIAYLIHLGSFAAILVLMVLVGFVVYRTHVIHRRKHGVVTPAGSVIKEKYNGEKIATRCTKNVNDILKDISVIFIMTIDGLSKENYRTLKKAYKSVQDLNAETKELKDNVNDTILNLEENFIETGHYYVQVLDYLREMAHSITFIIKPSFEHVDNNHKPLLAIQVTELKELSLQIQNFINEISKTIKAGKFENVNELIEHQQRILKVLDGIRKGQIKRIKANEVGTRNSMLYLAILAETKNLLLQLINLLKAQRDFLVYISNNNSQIINKD
ncbi:MAG: inorganic phosphate transporter [Bacteroidetes bacterium]|nr:inorganic phosphate transporter [Bacteroidota bacterium]